MQRAKPVELILVEGNKLHLTKAELEHRKKSETALKSGAIFKPSDAVKEDAIALREFNKLKRLYKDITYVEGLDENIINRYCLMVSEEYGIKKLIEKMNEDIDSCESFKDRMSLYQTINKALTTVKSIRGMLIKLEDRLFLNPTSRIKAIPKNPVDKEEQDPMELLLNRKPHKRG